MTVNTNRLLLNGGRVHGLSMSYGQRLRGLCVKNFPAEAAVQPTIHWGIQPMCFEESDP